MLTYYGHFGFSVHSCKERRFSRYFTFVFAIHQQISVAQGDFIAVRVTMLQIIILNIV